MFAAARGSNVRTGIKPSCGFEAEDSVDEGSSLFSDVQSSSNSEWSEKSDCQAEGDVASTGVAAWREDEGPTTAATFVKAHHPGRTTYRM